MPLPTPQKSTVSHFYKYASPSNLGWLKDILQQHEIYLPNLTQLNDDNDGLPRLAMQSEEEMANFLWDRFKKSASKHATRRTSTRRIGSAFQCPSARPGCASSEHCSTKWQ
jgi:hypothetical protein